MKIAKRSPFTLLSRSRTHVPFTRAASAPGLQIPAAPPQPLERCHMAHPRASVKVDRYLDAPASRRQVLTAFENLLDAHVGRYHTPLHTRAWRQIIRSVRRLGSSIREARSAY